MATRKNRRCPLPEEGQSEVPEPSSPEPPLPPNHPACPSRDERLLHSGQILEKTLPVVLRLIWAFRPLSHRRQQTAERAAAPTGHPDPESGRSTARKQKTADGAEAMAATEAADRLRTRAPRPGIGSLHGEETENGKRCGGNGSNRGSRSAAHPGTPTRNRTAQRREQGKRQTKRRRWQQRSCGGGRSIVRIRNGVKIMPPAEKRSFFLIFAP